MPFGTSGDLETFDILQRIRRKKMGIYEELQARGLIAQVTDEERIRDLVNSGKAVFYIGLILRQIVFM